MSVRGVLANLQPEPINGHHLQGRSRALVHDRDRCTDTDGDPEFRLRPSSACSRDASAEDNEGDVVGPCPVWQTDRGLVVSSAFPPMSAAFLWVPSGSGWKRSAPDTAVQPDALRVRRKGGDALRAVAATADSQELGGVIAPAQRYEVRNGRLSVVAIDRKGQKVTTGLCNFAASIDEEITYDDGAELRREFVISGRLDTGEPLPEARVGASELAALSWILREWGSRAVVFARPGTRDHLRAALQTLSRPARRRVFGHTGWIDRGEGPVFLFHGGAAGATGVEVELPPPLDRFRLPSEVVDAPDAVRCSLRLLDCGPLEVTAPLLAAVYLAPVSSILDPDTAVWLHGASGSLKSTLSGLAQAHFGAFDQKTLSASWTSTDNALMARLHVLKDVLTVIDDYAPQDDARAQRDLDRRVQRVLRDVGNRAGRSRLGGDLTQRPEHRPRGFLLCNGEALPPGHSINARLVQVEVERRRLDLEAITALQSRAHRLPHAIRGYVAWLAPRLGELATSLPRTRDTLRETFRTGGLHLRQPEALANLYLGIDLFLRFAVDTEAVPVSRADEIRGAVRTAFQTIAFRQGERLGTLEPTHIFVRSLATLLQEGRATLLSPGESSASGDTAVIGWRRGDTALVVPAAVCRQVAALVKDSGGRWAPSRRALHRNLVAQGYLLATPDGRNAGQWRVGREHRKQRGWLLRLDTLLPGGTDLAVSGQPRFSTAIGGEYRSPLAERRIDDAPPPSSPLEMPPSALADDTRDLARDGRRGG